MPEPIEVELKPEEFAALLGLLQGKSADLPEVAARFGIDAPYLAAEVVRYVHSVAYAGDFQQVLGALGLTAGQVLLQAQAMELRGEGTSLTEQLKDRINSSVTTPSTLAHQPHTSQDPLPLPGYRAVMAVHRSVPRAACAPAGRLVRRKKSWALPIGIGLALAASLSFCAVLPLFNSKPPSLTPVEVKPPVIIKNNPLPKLVKLNSGTGELHVAAGQKFTLSWEFDLGEEVAPGSAPPHVWLKADKSLRSYLQGFDQHEVRQPMADWKGGKTFTITYTLQITAAAGKDYPPLVPDVVQGSIRLLGTFGNRDLKAESTLYVHQGPDMVVSHFPPPPEATLTLKSEPNISYAAVCLVLDFSGSMAESLVPGGTSQRIDDVKKALKEVLEKIPPGSYVSVLVFGHKIGPQNLSADVASTRIKWVWEPKEWKKAQIKPLLEGIEAERPMNYSPIAEAMDVARKEGFPVNYQGPRVMLVLSDGQDNLRKNVPAFIKEKFLGSGIEINFVCFTQDQAEIAGAESQFKNVLLDVLETPGSFETVAQAANLAGVLEEAMRPRLLFFHDGQPVKGLEKGMPLPRPNNNPDPKKITLVDSTGIDLTVRLQKLKQDLRLRPGEFLPLIIAPGKLGLEFQRELLGKEFKHALASKNGKWLGAVAENYLNTNTATLTQLLTIEDLKHTSPGPGEIVQHHYPALVWLEPSIQSATKPIGFQWYAEYGHPAPAYRVKTAPCGLKEEPQLSVWFLEDGAQATAVAQKYPWEDLKTGKALFAPGVAVTIARVAKEERYISVGPNKKTFKDCLLVEVNYPPGKPVLLKPMEVNFQGEAHHYFSRAGRYVALFWGGDVPSQVNLISVNSLKESAKEARFLEWKLAPPSLKLTN